jgi:hypothetical protein
MDVASLESRFMDGRALYQPPQLAENAARRLYRAPDRTATVVGQLALDYDHYVTAAHLDPMSLEIQHGKNRTIHKAVIAPLCHEIELIADKRFLGATRYGELDTARYTHGTPQHEPVFPFEGAYAEYATIEGRVDAAAAEQFLDSLFSNDRHPLRPIWEAYQDIAPQFAVSEQKVRGFNRPLDPIQALRRITTYLGEHTILSFVMPTAFYYRHTQNLSGTRLTE